MKALYCSHGHENPYSNRFCSQCGEKLAIPTHPEPHHAGIPQTPSRYRIIRELGQGGFGRTYLAEDLNRFDDPCVLKEFAPQVQGTQALKKAAELFEREAGVLYKLNHPQIPKFRELFRVKLNNQGHLFLVQDFVAGPTYRQLLDTRKAQGLRFSEAEITELLRQLLPVLSYIHSLGVIHRDISPDNLIQRDTDGLPVLIDFGGVKQLAVTVVSQLMPSPTAIATRLGKVGYAPHEQMQSGLVYPSSDLYALAATVLTLLTGKEPQQLIEPRTLQWNWQHEVTLSPTLNSILEKMLQPTPEARYQRASELLDALMSPPAPVAHPPVQPPPFPDTQGTVAITPDGDAPTTGTPSPPSHPTLGWFSKILLVVALIFAAGSVGWWVGNWWIQSQIQQQPENEGFERPVVSPNHDSEPEPSSEFSSEEQQRKQALKDHRINLGIDYSFYVALVNEAFWQEYPNLRGRRLGSDPEDAELREKWDTVADELLNQIEDLNLSETTRKQLGQYGETDRESWKADANQLHISSRALYDLADGKFFAHFPNEEGKEFLNQPIGQVWQGIINDTLQRLKVGDGLEQIVFEPGLISKQITGVLKPGEGKVLIAQLSQDQRMDVDLSTDDKALFSIYSPTGEVKLLEDSRDRHWSGSLPESGYYEFVIVPHGSEPIDYQLDLTVQN